MKEMILDLAKLKKYRREIGGTELEVVICIDNTIRLERNVIYEWSIKEESKELVSVKFSYKAPQKTDNMKKGFASYQVTRNAEGNLVLIRVSE